MKQPSDFQYVFIVGCPRSGTTLLQEMLNMHPDIAIAPELFFLRLIYSKRNKVGDLSQESAQNRLIQKIYQINGFKELQWESQNFRTWLADNVQTYSELYRGILDYFGEKKRATVRGEKTPNNVLYMDTITELIPDAKFIHIIRDPRAVVKSWKTIPWSTGTIVGDAKKWRKYEEAYYKTNSQIKDNSLSIRYEDLVEKPEFTLKKLMSLLNRDYIPEMLSFYQHFPTSYSTTKEPWKEKTHSPLDPDRLYQWQQELHSEEISKIEGICHKIMIQWDYPMQSTWWDRSKYWPDYLRYPHWTFFKRKIRNLFV